MTTLSLVEDHKTQLAIMLHETATTCRVRLCVAARENALGGRCWAVAGPLGVPLCINGSVPLAALEGKPTRAQEDHKERLRALEAAFEVAQRMREVASVRSVLVEIMVPDDWMDTLYENESWVRGLRRGNEIQFLYAPEDLLPAQQHLGKRAMEVLRPEMVEALNTTVGAMVGLV